MHSFEFLKLAKGLFFRRLRHLGGFDLLFELRRLFGELVTLA
jgi:hypothetical protein